MYSTIVSPPCKRHLQGEYMLSTILKIKATAWDLGFVEVQSSQGVEERRTKGEGTQPQPTVPVHIIHSVRDEGIGLRISRMQQRAETSAVQQK